jgi:DNA-binding transcriptional MerR regulator
MMGEGSAGQSSVGRATVASPADEKAAPHGEHDRLWTVRELADELGVSLRTLRFYEAEGLIKPRRVGTNRIYSARDRARVRLILRGKRLGMSLAECREIVEMYDGAASSERRQLQTLLERLDDIAGDLRAREEDLQRTLAEVDEVAGQCRARLAELPALS